MQPVIYYCYDAYCGWCYGFSPVIKRLAEEYKNQLSFEVLSGGMIPADNPKHIGAMAGYISTAYKTVEERTGIQFGQDYLWHIFNPQESDWFPHSEKAAIALCIFKEIHADMQVQFVADLQYALHFEGRDLTDDEAYRHLIAKYKIDAVDFYNKLNSEAYKEKAHYEFALCRQLQVTGFPAVLLQAADTRFYLVAKGFTAYENLKGRVDNILSEINKQNPDRSPSLPQGKLAPKNDIKSREDIMLLMQEFYKKLLADKSISYLFTDIAKINLEQHLPVLVDFWDNILFSADTYRKNAMQPHLDLNEKSPISSHHFETWLRYFTETTDELFDGEKSFLAKERATSIATIMKIKLKQKE